MIFYHSLPYDRTKHNTWNGLRTTTPKILDFQSHFLLYFLLQFWSDTWFPFTHSFEINVYFCSFIMQVDRVPKIIKHFVKVDEWWSSMFDNKYESYNENSTYSMLKNRNIELSCKPTTKLCELFVLCRYIWCLK